MSEQTTRRRWAVWDKREKARPFFVTGDLLAAFSAARKVWRYRQMFSLPMAKPHIGATRHG